jgi:transposase
MGAVVELSDPEWKRIEHLFDPAGRRGAPARHTRRDMVEAMLFLARTGCQWRYLPTHYPLWSAVWQQWRRWRETGVWAKAMRLIADEIRSKKRAHIQPTMVMIDAQTVKGGRAGETFHNAGGRGGVAGGRLPRRPLHPPPGRASVTPASESVRSDRMRASTSSA